MSKKHILLILSIFSCAGLLAQAGTGVYQFLDLPVSSRLAALGGINVSLCDNDINFAFQNPALLTKETNNMIGLNMANYLADIKFGSAMYSHNIDNKNYLALGMEYVDYGKFRYADEINTENDVITYFTAKDMVLNAIYARPITKNITVGGTLKAIYSAYERYSSFGMALDAGVSYNDPVLFFSAGLVLKNMGTQFKGYYSDDYGQHFEVLPFNIELGASKKLSHAPFRFSVNLHNLQHWDLSYITDDKDVKFIDMAFRHTILGLEFLPGKNIYLAASYNHRRHQELKMDGFKSMAGFSFGGGIKLSKFQVGFGMSQFQVGNYAYLFSISTNLNKFKF